MATWKKVLFEGEGGAGDHLFNANLTMPGNTSRSHTISSGSSFDINGPTGADFFLSQTQIRLGDTDFAGTLELKRDNASLSVLSEEVSVDAPLLDLNTDKVELQLKDNPSPSNNDGNIVISQEENGSSDPRPRIVLRKEDPSPASFVNHLGCIYFQGYNTVDSAVNTYQDYAQISSYTDDVVASEEKGRLDFSVMNDGALDVALSLKSRTVSGDDVTGVALNGTNLRALMTPTLVGPWTGGPMTAIGGTNTFKAVFLGGAGVDASLASDHFNPNTTTNAALLEVPIIRDCSVTGVSFRCKTTHSASAQFDIRFNLYKNGSFFSTFKVFSDVVDESSGLSNTSRSDSYSIFSPYSTGAASFSAGDLLGLRLGFVSDSGSSNIDVDDFCAFLEITYA